LQNDRGKEKGTAKNWLWLKNVLKFTLSMCYTVVVMIGLQLSTKEVTVMKKGIHPEYGEAIVRCACGETFVTGSTKKEIRVEICSKCHPFFTGKQKLVDTGGRVERFKKRYELNSDQV